VHVPAVGLEREVVDALPSFAVPSVSKDMICVWPRVKSAEP